MVQYRPTQHVGQENIQRHGSRMVLMSQGKRICTTGRHKDLKPFIQGKVAQHTRIMWIIFKISNTASSGCRFSRSSGIFSTGCSTDNGTGETDDRDALSTGEALDVEGPTYVCGK